MRVKQSSQMQRCARKVTVMQAGDVKLGTVFANDHVNNIPLFQRPYVWDEEDNWLPLWQDVTRAAQEVEAEQAQDEPSASPPTYFLGAVVLQERRRPPKRLASSNIIDGQQRLTTLQVLLGAARYVAHELGAESVENRFTGLLENRELVLHEEHPDDLYKLWPLPQDRAAFLWAVRRPTDLTTEPLGDHRLTRARLWFEGEIRDWAKQAAEPAHRLDALHFALQERMQLVKITLDASDDPQVIFEALNHRGVRLAAADLVKNLLFQTVESQGDRLRAELLLTGSWLPLDDKPWRERVTTGRIRRYLVDLLLSYWLTIRSEKEVVTEHLFVDFKAWLKNSGSRAADVIEELRHYADTYSRVLALPGHAPSAELVNHMQATNTTTPWPLLLFLHATDVPQPQRDRAVRALESYLVRRDVCGWTTKDYNRLFLQVLGVAQRAGAESVGDAVVSALATQSALSRVWPTDSDLIAVLTRRPLYDRLSAAKIRAFMVGLENFLRSGKTEPQEFLSRGDQRLNIEHLLPQKWTTHWPVAKGDAEAADRRNSKIDMVGNLTLLTSKLNSAMQNNPWRLKRPAIQSHSLLRLTTASVLTSPSETAMPDEWAGEWDERRIDLRTMYITSLALERWPRPDAAVEATDD